MTKSGDDVRGAGETSSDGTAAPVDVERAEVRCRWCRHILAVQTGRGRKREFCSQRCRQWDWVSRQRARELDLSDRELVIARAELEDLHDQLYILSCAVADTERDLADGLDDGEALTALAWLLEAARPLANRRLAAGGSASGQ